MYPQIIFLSPLKALKQLIDEVCIDLGEKSYTILDNFGDDLTDAVKKLALKGSKVIICKEFAATSLDISNLNVPVIYIYTSPFDVLYNIYLASKKYKKITFLAFFKEASRYNFQSFEQILNVKIEPFLYKTPEEIETMFNVALGNGIEFILTTGECIAKKAKKLNIPAQVIFPNRETIIEAIDRSRNIINARRKDDFFKEQLTTIINTVDDGIILLNNLNKVVLINKIAEERCGKNNFLDKLINSVTDSSFVNERIIKIDDCHLLVSKRILSLVEGEKNTLINFRDVNEVQRQEQRIRLEMIKKGLNAKFSFSDLVGQSDVFKRTVEKAKRYAQSDSTVLITGESGTGKELFAQSIHNASARKNNPFVGINCAALPESLLESELFGYERGSFTGAEKTGKQGLFELAHNGTIFFDEIVELPLSLQAKLLRVLQEKEVRRIGGDKIILINVRIIAATNKDLKKEVEEGRFRSDLYYRLNVLRLGIPPLRDRKEDISLLTVYLLTKHAKNSQVPELTPELINKLNKHSWPGNVRELENFCERYLLIGNDQLSVEEDIKEWFLPCPQNNFNAGEGFILINESSLSEMESEIILKTLQKFNGNKNKVAKSLGISRTTLWKKIKNNHVSNLN